MPENVEIERRFLVDGRFERPWVHESTECIEIKQWYLDHKEFDVSIEHNAVMYKKKQLVSGLSQEICRTLLQEPNWTVRIRKSHSAYVLTLRGLERVLLRQNSNGKLNAILQNPLSMICCIPLSRKNATFGQIPMDLFGKLMSLKAILLG